MAPSGSLQPEAASRSGPSQALKTVLLAMLLLLPGISAAGDYESALEPLTTQHDYLAIEFMSAGPSDLLPSRGDIEGLPAATPQEKKLRVVVYRSEAYQDVSVEAVTTGLEGCCAKLASSGRLNLASFAEHFGFKGEISGFVFVGWSSHHSFDFTYNHQPFRATVFDSGEVVIQRGTASGVS